MHHEHGRPRVLGRRRVELVRADPQPVRPRALRGRLVERLGGGPLVRRHRPRRRLRPGRLDPRARLVVRASSGSSRRTRSCRTRASRASTQTFDHCGPLARTAEGTALLLQAMAGLDPGDPRQREVPERRLRRRGRARGRRPQRPAHRRRRRRASPRAWAPSRRPARPCARPPSGSPASAPSCTSARCPSTSRRAASRSPASSRA